MPPFGRDLGRNGLGGGGIEIGDNDLSPLGCDGSTRRGADAASAAGDDHDLVLNPSHHSSVLSAVATVRRSVFIFREHEASVHLVLVNTRAGRYHPPLK